MARPLNPDLTKHWKISLPATLAGTVEFYLFDPIHSKPLYGSRAKLIAQLLTDWVEQQKRDAAAKQPDYRVTVSGGHELFDDFKEPSKEPSNA